ncbi:MAG: hypothetical protein ACI85K_001735 [Hyphomicrobiaceae bacterium]|jgi:hypothetical protein
MKTPPPPHERQMTLATAVLGLILPTVLWTGCSAPAKTVVKQNSAPSTAQVRDGLGPDSDSQEARTSLFANWDAFVDPEGHPVVYEWSVGTKPGATDVLEWQHVAGSLRAAASNLDLPLGVTLHTNVRAVDLEGHWSAIASSDGIVVGEYVHRQSGMGASPDVVIPAGHLAGVDRHGITWTFDRPARCGRYVNGDWWVLGPISITSIKPASLQDGPRARHGSMINPSPSELTQGYDSAMFGNGATGRYDKATNVALNVSRKQPLALVPGTSLVSTVSHPMAGQLPQIESCAVLTCIAEQPAANAFRPPYCGTDKDARWTADNLDMTQFARLPAAAGAPPIRDLVERFERTWLDHLPGYTGRYLHPRQNMPDYGRDLAELVGIGALTLQLDIPLANKRPLLIAMVQLGIDTFGIVKNGGRFLADGGSGSGRKFPLLLAGSVLHDNDMLKLASERKLAFAEDAQTFYVTATNGEWNRGHGGYGPGDAGLPEWGNRHADDPSHDRKAWTADPYRRCCTANVWHGYILAARIMGLRDAWDHPALFDYVDRYMQIETQGNWMRGWNPFCEQMWDRYRADF